MAQRGNRFERRRKRLSIVVMVAVLATIAGWGAIAGSSPTGAARVPATSR